MAESIASSRNSLEILVVLLDLETSGFEADCDILQIAAKCEEKSFSTYVSPVQDISAHTSSVNGLENRLGVLFFNGIEVPSVHVRTALENLLIWLKSFNMKCCIATHNLSFDGPRLFRFMVKYSMVSEFKDVVHGFADTLKVIGEVAGAPKGSRSLEKLARKYEIDGEGAHNAENDCLILYKILKVLKIANEEILEHSNTFEYQTKYWAALTSLKPLEYGEIYVSHSVRQKIAEAGITMEKLRDIYETDGYNGLEHFFKEKFLNKEMKRLKDSTISKIVRWFSINKRKL